MSKQSRKKKNNKKRRILLALLLIIFTGSILTASTYAWFTSNRTVKVDTIDVQVSAANGLQISTDAINWKTIITNDDLNDTLEDGFGYSSNVNQLPLTGNNNATVKPVSSALDIENGKLKMFLGSLENDDNGNPVLTTTRSTETKGQTGDFVVFDLFFQVTQETAVKLAEGSDVTISEGTTSNKGLKSAARVAWLNLGHVGTDASASDAQALPSGTSDTASVRLWEPNNNAHTTAAINDARSVYNLTIGASTEVTSYYGVKAAFTERSLRDLSASNIGTNFATVTPNTKSPVNGLTADADWFTLQPGVTKIRFYLWIEGQDVDCENNASGDALAYKMSFVIAS